MTGARFDPDIASVAAEADIPLALMHSVGNPGSMPHAMTYDDVVADVLRSLEESVALVLERGVRGIIVDPGFGFGKSVITSYSIHYTKLYESLRTATTCWGTTNGVSTAMTGRS